MKYTNENEIFALVESFENGTISREDWKHAEHLTVGLFYVWHNDFDAALDKMRAGIFNLLRAFEVDFNKEMPYHETLTHFWIKTIYEHKNVNAHLSLPEICGEIIEKFDKDYPLRFYSRELLFSDETRKSYVAADLI